jgi:hypothetical protein
MCHDEDGLTRINYASSQGKFSGETDWSSARLNDPYWCRIGDYYEMLTGDFDGDGDDDIMCKKTTDGQTWIDYAYAGKFYGTNYSNSDGWCITDPGTNELMVGDFNGDSVDDLACHKKSSGKVWIDYGSKSYGFSGTNWSGDFDFCQNSNETLHSGDVNADGSDDLVCYDSDYGVITELFGSNDKELSTTIF